MCGISGVFSQSPIASQEIRLIKKMNDLQQHRGPDDEGLFADHFCALGHRRLAIIDLSPSGHQPFHSRDNRYILTYNGEIYNYIELREELRAIGWEFYTQTDTEVLLVAYSQYGPNCLEKFNGMFAFAIYDAKERSLFLARDRFGIKPLYYVRWLNKIYFASEIKALRAIPGFSLSVNEQAVFDFFVFSRTDIFDETFHNEIKRLPKGHYATFKEGVFKLQQWWDPEKFLENNQDSKRLLEEVTATIERIFISATEWQMRSDVSVGSCLSGGVDSSILTGILLARNKVGREYPTFTATFPGFACDEAKYVHLLNQKYDFTSYKIEPQGEEAYERLEEFIYINDEPVSSASFYSQYEVMRLAKEKGVTVLLDGQGADEIFAGYHYFHGFNLFGLLRQKKYFRFFQELFCVLFRHQKIEVYETLIFKLLSPAMRENLLYRRYPFLQKRFFEYYLERSRIYNDFFNADDLNASIVRHFQLKLEHLLRIEDRNSMAFSVEARVPYLDHRLVEYVLGVEASFKIKAGETKYLQKRALGKYTIEEILNRRDKLGFATPQRDWMRQPKWQKRTKASEELLGKVFPHIFKKTNNRMFNDTNFCWKVNQLAVWRQISMGATD